MTILPQNVTLDK